MGVLSQNLQVVSVLASANFLLKILKFGYLTWKHEIFLFLKNATSFSEVVLRLWKA